MTSRLTSLAVGVILVAVPLLGQPARTFISAAGDDLNNCVNLSPCRTLQRGIDAAAANGEVVPLDSAGYGTVVITKSITVAVPAGVYAGVTTLTAGTPGLTINTPGVNVKLRGLSINSLGGQYGIYVGVGNVILNVERSAISGFPFAAVWFSSAGGRLAVFDSLIRDSGAGIAVSSGDPGSPAVAVIDNAQFSGNGGGSSGAVVAGTSSRVNVRNSVAHANFRGFEVEAEDPNFTTMKVENSSATDNVVGLFATNTGVSAIATMYVSNCLIAHNTLYAIEVQSGSLIHSRGNNTVVDNAAGENFSDTYSAK